MGRTLKTVANQRSVNEADTVKSTFSSICMCSKAQLSHKGCNVFRLCIIGQDRGRLDICICNILRLARKSRARRSVVASLRRWKATYATF
jgi:hypothetical protein